MKIFQFNRAIPSPSYPNHGTIASQSLVASHLRREVIRERWIIVTQLLLQVKNSFELRHERASHSFFEQNKGPLKMHGSSSLIISRQRVVKSDGHSLFQQVISYPQSQLILHRTCPTKATKRWPSWTSTLAKINHHTIITEVSLFTWFFNITNIIASLLSFGLVNPWDLRVEFFGAWVFFENVKKESLPYGFVRNVQKRQALLGRFF